MDRKGKKKFKQKENCVFHLDALLMSFSWRNSVRANSVVKAYGLLIRRLGVMPEHHTVAVFGPLTKALNP